MLSTIFNFRFEMLLQRDQQYVVKPDYEVPFTDQKDAVQRLMKYHIYRDRNEMEFEDFDSEFANNATILLDKFSVMMSKYRNLLLKESTVSHMYTVCISFRTFGLNVKILN